MALIGTIRNNMWFVFVLIALATAAFILMDAQGPGGGATASTPIGVINGEKITNLEFDRAYQTLFSNAQDPHSSRAGLWNYFVEQKIIQEEADKLGLYIGYDELMDLQFGQNISPIIYQNFLNPTTGQVDFAQLQQIKQQLESGTEMNANFRQFWAEQEKQIKKTQLQAKLELLASKAIYTPNWLAEEAYSEENAQVDMAVVKIPFDNIPGDNIEVAESDISDYISKNKEDFELKEEKRVVDFVSLRVYPSSLDTAQWLEDAQEVVENWKGTSEDSIFAINNNGIFRDYYASEEEIDEFYQDKIGGYEIGGVYGPYVLGNSYQVAKLIDKRIVPDSVKARHILRRAVPTNAAAMAEANRLIDSLMLVAKRRTTPFDTLAAQFSQDQTNNLNGGDLGYFTQGIMVPAFNKATFINGREGDYVKVTTSFGVHLVYIEDLVYNNRRPKYKMAYANVPIIPSKETQDDAYERMFELVSSYPYLEDLTEAVDQDAELSMEKSNDLAINDYSISNLGAGNTSREIVRWAFNGDTEINDVSPTVFIYTDPINYFNSRYVIAGLSQIKKPGMMKPRDVRNQVEFAVLNQKKGASVVPEITGKELSAIAQQYGVEVDTFLNLNLLNSFVAGLGNEPKVLGQAFKLDVGQTGSPIVGNSGVFVVKTINKTEAGAPSNIGFIKRTVSQRLRENTSLLLIDALKRKVDIKDNRSIFF